MTKRLTSILMAACLLFSSVQLVTAESQTQTISAMAARIIRAFITPTDASDPASDSIGMDLNGLLAQLNEERRAETAEHYAKADILLYLEDFTESLDLVTEEEVLDLNTEKNAVVSVSKEGALRDVDLLFRVYKAFYASYTYFGGDETFGKAKEAIAGEIEAQTGEQIQTAWLARTICEHLSFMRDGHAVIGDLEFYKQNAQVLHDYYVRGRFFYRDEKGLFTRIGAGKAYLTAVGDDQNTEDYLRLSIDGIGRLCYILSVSGTESSEEQRISSVSMDLNGISVSIPVQWTAFTERSWGGSEWVQTISFEQDIPFVRICDRQNGERDEELERTFSEISALLTDQDVVIYDILTTGSGRFAVCGRDIPMGNEVRAYKVSKVLQYAGMRNYPLETSAGNWAVRVWTGNWHSNQRVQFILQDHNNASAHEDFLNGMATVENTVFAGVRSAGLQITGGNHMFWLPESHLCFQCGMFLSFQRNSVENRDGIGYEPDLWIDLSEAPDALRRLCAYYGLENTANTERIRDSRFSASSPQYADGLSLIRYDTGEVFRNGDTIPTALGRNCFRLTCLDTVVEERFELELQGEAPGTAVISNNLIELNGKAAGQVRFTVTYKDRTATFIWKVE